MRTPDDPFFAAFWSLWRRHMRKTDGRGKARPAFYQMLDAGAAPQDIIDGAAWYLRNLTERDAPYIPLASSWLRSERWADDCEQERAHRERMAERESNVVDMQRPKPVLPENHFSRQWAERKQAAE